MLVRDTNGSEAPGHIFPILAQISHACFSSICPDSVSATPREDRLKSKAFEGRER
jgi:hypothetical protein